MVVEIFAGKTRLQWAKIFIGAARAGAKAMRRYLQKNRTFTTIAKTKGDFVTQLDLASSRAVKAYLAKMLGRACPPILDEEVEESHKLIETAELIIVLDPEDGTQTENAAGGRSQNTGVGLSLIFKGRVIVAAALQRSAPGWNTIVAMDGEGAFLVRKFCGFTRWKKVRIDDGRPIPKSLVVAIPLSHASPPTAYAQYIEPLMKAKIIGNSGGFFCAIGNMFGLVVRRDMHVYANVTGGTVYDLGPLDLIVREAGGVAVTVRGERIVWDRMIIPCLFARNEEAARKILGVWNPA